MRPFSQPVTSNLVRLRPERPLCHVQSVTGFWPHFPFLSFTSSVQSLSSISDWRNLLPTNLHVRIASGLASPARLSVLTSSRSSLCSRTRAPNDAPQFPANSSLTRCLMIGLALWITLTFGGLVGAENLLNSKSYVPRRWEPSQEAVHNYKLPAALAYWTALDSKRRGWRYTMLRVYSVQSALIRHNDHALSSSSFPVLFANTVVRHLFLPFRGPLSHVPPNVLSTTPAFVVQPRLTGAFTYS
ncbi:hypothetical protein BKA66DRAFT_65094 [Pyrenochaeta sp. MPI-SDFR-AT-0127]|nr:hypothetical protein BKA66DRAFT_65094 [Pyrenochaeta sp. MPI-SDFR-AT-0127]